METERQEYLSALCTLRRIRRLAKKLHRTPQGRLRVGREDAEDAAYVTEWMEIVLCRICGQADVPMPPFRKEDTPAEQFCWHILKIARQARAMRLGLFWNRIDKKIFAKKAWEGLENAESFLRSFLSDNVCRGRRFFA